MTAKAPRRDLFVAFRTASHELPTLSNGQGPALRPTSLVRDSVSDVPLHMSADSGRDSGCPGIGTVGERYRLTRAEMRVLTVLMEVGGISEIAALLAISPTTVKTHLRHIFQKTGAKGQIELVRLVVRTAWSSES
jgi:DNA-binding CsgD family transcriptional regulator